MIQMKNFQRSQNRWGQRKDANTKKAEPSFGIGVSEMSFSQKFAAESKDDAPKTSGRARKRDPSFGGVADMFSDDPEPSSEEERDTGTSPSDSDNLNSSDQETFKPTDV